MIVFDQVRKSFAEREVLKDISFNVPAGQILFILGTSGTGKSVLLKNIVGLMQPSAGHIWVDGEEVSRLSEELLFPIRRKCGMVFQHPALFDSLTVFDNVAFGLRQHYPHWTLAELTERVEECLRWVQLKPAVGAKRPQEISYGMQKRVSLARTVAIKPKILLFDEPTTGLDPVTTQAINQLIFDLSRRLQTTSLVVSHDMHCALAIADQIMVLDQGQIVAQGSPNQMRTHHHPLVREFLKEALHAEMGH